MRVDGLLVLISRERDFLFLLMHNEFFLWQLSLDHENICELVS